MIACIAYEVLVGEVLDETDFGADFSMPSGTSLLGRLRLSNVTPFWSFVNPTTGGSPFFTNSQSPRKIINTSIFENICGAERTRKLVSCQSEGLPGDLLVNVTPQLKNNPAHRKPDGPVVELSLSLTHTHLISGCVDTNVGAHALVKFVIHSSQPSTDGLLPNFQLRRRHTSVVVLHSQAIITPNDCCSSV